MFLNRGKVLFRNYSVNKNISKLLLSKGGLNKFFSAAASHGHEQEKKGDSHGENHGDSHGDNHGEGHEGHDDHGHHDITGEVDLNKVNVPLNANLSRFISLTGVPSSESEIKYTIEGENKAKGEITPIAIPLLTRNRVYFNDLANVRYEDNPYFHSEPYGYFVSDDPWDPNPSLWQPYMMIMAGIFGALIFSKMFRLYNLKEKRILSEEIYHAHYTANLIEDEIRSIRREDYPWRKRYEEMKNGNSVSV